MKIVDSNYNNYQLNMLEKLISDMNLHESVASGMSNDEIYLKFHRHKSREEELELTFLLAMVREVFSRTINIIPYHEQFICAVSLYLGTITEMKTGEGKSIVSVISAILLSLKGKVHISTVNDYLARRDYEIMKSIYDIFGLSVGVNKRDKDSISELYENDIVYSSSEELIFDYLRNELLPINERIEFPLNAVIIDEVDFVLLDNAISMFSISAGENFPPKVKEFELAKTIYAGLIGEERDKEAFFEDIPDPIDAHYVYYNHNKLVHLTESGFKFLEELFNTDDIILNYFELYKAVIYTLEANLFYRNGKDYIVDNDKITLISQANGRLQDETHLENDLHTAIEIKENVKVTSKNLLSNSLSYQIFFTKYQHMVGMSGTVYDAREEFEELFKVATLFVPTHKPNMRKDHPDIYFKTLKDKYDYLVEYITNIKKSGQPVLIIANTEKESETIYNLFDKFNITHTNLLNAQNTEEEAQLVKNAGNHDVITISTNVSGRGTDIILDDIAKEAGGLLVIILSRNISKRIDEQARGRAGRQGQIGESIIFVSMEDEIWNQADRKLLRRVKRIIKSKYEYMLIPERKKVGKILDSIQRSIQMRYYDSRQYIYYMDYIIEKYREKTNMFKREVHNSLDIDILLEYIGGLKFNLNDFNDLFGSGIERPFVEVEELKQAIIDKKQGIGEHNSKLLLQQLITNLIDKHWLYYKNDLERMKYYVLGYGLAEMEMIRRFIEICDEEFDKLTSKINNELIAYYVTAEMIV